MKLFATVVINCMERGLEDPMVLSYFPKDGKTKRRERRAKLRKNKL